MCFSHSIHWVTHRYMFMVRRKTPWNNEKRICCNIKYTFSCCFFTNRKKSGCFTKSLYAMVGSEVVPNDYAVVKENRDYIYWFWLMYQFSESETAFFYRNIHDKNYFTHLLSFNLENMKTVIPIFSLSLVT